jgi:hypothetical protein
MEDGQRLEANRLEAILGSITPVQSQSLQVRVQYGVIIHIKSNVVRNPLALHYGGKVYMLGPLCMGPNSLIIGASTRVMRGI